MRRTGRNTKKERFYKVLDTVFPNDYICYPCIDFYEEGVSYAKEKALRSPLSRSQEEERRSGTRSEDRRA